MELLSPIGIALVVAAYLCGSVASAIVVCRLVGLPDPRAGGSGNPGATNVLRLGGKGPAAMTLLGDVLKGIIPVIAARSLDASPELCIAVALAAFLGHLFPIFFRFQGGKGMATAFGVVAALNIGVLLAMGLTWLIVAAAFRYASLASLVAAISAPVAALALGLSPWTVTGLAVMAALLIWRHHDNVQRLMSGAESKLGQKA